MIPPKHNWGVHIWRVLMLALAVLTVLPERVDAKAKHSEPTVTNKASSAAATKRTGATTNKQRFDPYKNFKFR
jgi:hypothetical protein